MYLGTEYLGTELLGISRNNIDNLIADLAMSMPFALIAMFLIVGNIENDRRKKRNSMKNDNYYVDIHECNKHKHK